MRHELEVISALFALGGLCVIIFLFFAFWLGRLFFGGNLTEQIRRAYLYISDGVAYVGNVPEEEAQLCCGLFNRAAIKYRYRNFLFGVIAFAVLTMCSTAVSCISYTCFDKEKYIIPRIVLLSFIGLCDLLSILLLFPIYEDNERENKDPSNYLSSQCCKIYCNENVCSSVRAHNFGAIFFFILNPVCGLILGFLDMYSIYFSWFFIGSIITNGICLILVLMFLVGDYIVRRQPNAIRHDQLTNIYERELENVVKAANYHSGFALPVEPDRLAALPAPADLFQQNERVIFIEYFLFLFVVIANIVTIVGECAVTFFNADK